LVKGQPRILVDSGPGSFARLGEARLPLDQLDTILLTHLHIDHAGELPGVMKARAVSAGRPISFDVYGPVGHASGPGVPAFPSTERFMTLLFGADGAFAYLKDFAAPITFKATNLPPAATAGQQPFVVRDRGGVRISAVAGHHGDAPSVIYRIDFEGRSVVFSGDIDASGLPALGMISRGADLLVFDAVVLDPPASPEVLYSLHSPPKAIGPLAESSQVKLLVLSHLSPAVDEQRAAVTASIANYYHGGVKFAADGMRLSP
jgi:ribonuclease BN (tRNA processing enzyme)